MPKRCVLQGASTQTFKDICKVPYDMWIEGLGELYKVVNWKHTYEDVDEIQDASERLIMFMTEPKNANARKKMSSMVSHYVKTMGYTLNQAIYIVVTKQMGVDIPKFPVTHFQYLPKILFEVPEQPTHMYAGQLVEVGS